MDQSSQQVGLSAFVSACALVGLEHLLRLLPDRLGHNGLAPRGRCSCDAVPAAFAKQMLEPALSTLKPRALFLCERSVNSGVKRISNHLWGPGEFRKRAQVNARGRAPVGNRCSKRSWNAGSCPRPVSSAVAMQNTDRGAGATCQPVLPVVLANNRFSAASDLQVLEVLNADFSPLQRGTGAAACLSCPRSPMVPRAGRARPRPPG
jgi:hypothetical protein